MSDRPVKKHGNRLFTPQWNDFLGEMFPGIDPDKINRVLTAEFSTYDFATLERHSARRWERRDQLLKIRRPKIEAARRAMATKKS